VRPLFQAQRGTAATGRTSTWGRMAEKFYLQPFGFGPMGMNIKDPAVHAMAKQLAARRGTSVTDAVRQALQADLARTPDFSNGAARAQELQELLASCRRLPRLDSRTSRDLQDSLYGDDGLPS